MHVQGRIQRRWTACRNCEFTSENTARKHLDRAIWDLRSDECCHGIRCNLWLRNQKANRILQSSYSEIAIVMLTSCLEMCSALSATLKCFFLEFSDLLISDSKMTKMTKTSIIDPESLGFLPPRTHGQSLNTSCTLRLVHLWKTDRSNIMLLSTSEQW